MLWMGKHVPPSPAKSASEASKDSGKLAHGSPSSPSILAVTPPGAMTSPSYVADLSCRLPRRECRTRL